MADYITERIKCPFFKSCKLNSIVCEGVQENSTLHLSFSGRGDMMRYINSHCVKHKSACMVAALLYSKYEK